MRAIRFHYRPLRYLLTRHASRHLPAVAWGPLGCVRYDEVEPPPLPGPDWVRVETSLAGICGSDLSALTAHDSFTLEPFGAYPFTFGHENVGRVVETGAAAGDWAPGERVAVNPMLGCLQRGLSPPCAACARGDYGLCRRTADGVVGGGPTIGYCPGTGGGWARSFLAHRSQLHALGGLSDEEGVLTDPFATACRAALLHPPAEDDTVLVIGSGTIGALLIRALRQTGWTGPIAVMARHGFQRELAERAGAGPILASRTECYAWAAALPGARAYRPTLAPRFVEGGPSLVFDTVGSAGSLGDALALTREAGRIVLVGSAARLPADWTRVWYRQLTVSGVFVYGTTAFEGERVDIFQAALTLMRRRSLADLAMLTHVFPLAGYRRALATALDKRGQHSVKVAFQPGG
jgi:L-iditol 2-dehydrogenase